MSSIWKFTILCAPHVFENYLSFFKIFFAQELAKKIVTQGIYNWLYPIQTFCSPFLTYAIKNSLPCYWYARDKLGLGQSTIDCGINSPAEKKIEKTNNIKAQIQRVWAFWHLARFYDSAKRYIFFHFMLALKHTKINT